MDQLTRDPPIILLKGGKKKLVRDSHFLFLCKAPWYQLALKALAFQQSAVCYLFLPYRKKQRTYNFQNKLWRPKIIQLITYYLRQQTAMGGPKEAYTQTLRGNYNYYPFHSFTDEEGDNGYNHDD